jgi:glutathione S-transferase
MMAARAFKAAGRSSPRAAIATRAAATEAPAAAAAGATAAAQFAAPYLAAVASCADAPAAGYRDAGPPPAKFTPGSGTLLSVAAAAFAPVARLGSGALAYGYAVERGDASAPENVGRYAVLPGAYETSLVSTLPRPAQPLVLFEFQSCPFCAKVREAVSYLDLDVLFFPCPKDGERFRPEAVRLGGKAQFPLLLDAGAAGGPKLMYESDDIIRYLFRTYGPGEDKIPGPLTRSTLATVSAGLALLPRGGAGGRAAAGRKAPSPSKPLVLWAYEASPFVRIVRERLGELELPHLQVTCARGSAAKRQRLLDARGAFQVPYLEDPNAGVYLFESAAILKYLNETYA